MDFQETMRRAGNVTKDIGNQILIAAEKEDISVLRSINIQLREVMDILNVVTLCDQMARAPNKITKTSKDN